MTINPNIFPSKIFYDASQDSWAEAVMARLQQATKKEDLPMPSFEIVDSEDDIPRMDLKEGKSAWYLTEKKGSWTKKCPGTKGFVCCTYFVINMGEGCPFDCTYCYLQGYLNQPLIKMYGNVDPCLTELSDIFSSASRHSKGLHYRVGTGEYMDSLALDPILRSHEPLVRFFKQHPQHILELKTKSHHVDHLLTSELVTPNVHFSWTISPPYVHEKYEKRTSSVDLRLKAAKKVLHAGYGVTLNLDPIVVRNAQEKEQLLAFIHHLNHFFDDLELEKTIPIFLGTVRISPNVKEALIERWDPEDIDYLWDEMVPQVDAKFRYEFSRRANLYRSVSEALSKTFQPTLCMEPKEMWEAVFGAHPKKLEAQRPYFSMIG